MTLEQAAKEIATKADECCNRGEEYQKPIEDLALQKLKDAYNLGVEDIAHYLELNKWHSLPEIIRRKKI